MRTVRFVICILLALVYVTVLAEAVVEVVTVYHRPASEIEPLLIPLLEDTDRIVANGDSIIVKTTAGRLPEITRIIGQLDNPINNLLITVIQSRELTAEQLNAGMGFSIHTPLHDPARTGGYIGGYYNQNQGRSGERQIQSIRTMDGVPAYIKAGKVVPVTNRQVYRDSYGYPYENRSTQLIEATSGFEVIPRLAGQQVMLDVSPWSDRLGNQGQIQTQQATTALRVNLGEWVDIGGVELSGYRADNSPLDYNRQQNQNQLRILVKVDIVK